MILEIGVLSNPVHADVIPIETVATFSFSSSSGEFVTDGPATSLASTADLVAVWHYRANYAGSASFSTNSIAHQTQLSIGLSEIGGIDGYTTTMGGSIEIITTFETTIPYHVTQTLSGAVYAAGSATEFRTTSWLDPPVGNETFMSTYFPSTLFFAQELAPGTHTLRTTSGGYGRQAIYIDENTTLIFQGNASASSVLSFTAVPEPSFSTLALLGLPLILGRRAYRVIANFKDVRN